MHSKYVAIQLANVHVICFVCIHTLFYQGACIISIRCHLHTTMHDTIVEKPLPPSTVGDHTPAASPDCLS